MREMAKISDFYKALGDETRLKILELVAAQEMCVCELIEQLGMSQSAVSHHLKILKQAGLVQDDRDGKWIYYSLNPDAFMTVFKDDDSGFIPNYAEPIRQKLLRMQSSQIRRDSSVCETLTSKQK